VTARLGSIAFAWLAAASAGCFYVEPINQRPALDIVPASSTSVFRGDTITLDAVANDPEKQIVAFQWRVYACHDATSSSDCDLDPVFTGIEPEATFRVPPFRADPDGPGPAVAPPTESLRVLLEGRDDHGAATKSPQLLVVPVANAPPNLALRVASTHGAVVMTSIDVYAKYGDVDDTPQNVSLEWIAYSPSQVPAPLVEVAVPPDGDPTHLQQGRRFVPSVTGNWDIRVVATDKAGGSKDDHLIVTVLPDAPPCLDAWDPAATAQPAPITEPTLFEVLRVRDDLDAFPRTSSDPDLGDPQFEWSIKVGAGPRQALANPVSSLVFDPLAYAPGTLVELRVEIFDRKHTAINCADAAQTCSVISQPTCIQRQTWTVEAR
jgi:hypothetical protein